MAWIESHQNLERHPKLLDLAIALGTDKFGAIGRLHCLWWWCLEYALDGDLRKFNPEAVSLACSIPIDILVRCEFVDALPYRRIHDWWDYAGDFIKIKFKNYPEKWMRIEHLYKNTPKVSPKGAPKNPPKDDNQTLTLTLHNHTTVKDTEAVEKPTAPASVISNRSPMDIIRDLSKEKSLTTADVPRTPSAYKPPDTPLQKFLVGIKYLQGFDLEDREWDKTYFKRYSRAATDMLNFFKGDWKAALACAEAIVKDLESKKLSWTVETLVKHAPHYRKATA
jgi:hypothetical protein